jgi:hypothetical protein
VNGLEDKCLPEDSDLDFSDYVTAANKINLRAVLANFGDFIARMGCRILKIKIWGSQKRYQAGKHQLARYLDLEQVEEGYYVVFDHRSKPQAREDEEHISGKTIVSFCIPVPQERLSQ